MSIPSETGMLPAEAAQNGHQEDGTSPGSNDQMTSPEARAFLAVAVPLIKEYSVKLGDLSDGLLAVWREKGSVRGTLSTDQEFTRDGLLLKFKYLQPALKKWINASSALLEEGLLSRPLRLELEIRLAELEAQYLTTTQVIHLFGQS